MAEITGYAIRKHLARSGLTKPTVNGFPITTTPHLFELYLARLVIIAEALAQGYAQRSEVLEIVEAMERQILAQLDVEPSPATEAELHLAYARISTPPDRAKSSFEELRPSLEQVLLQQKRQEAKCVQSSISLRAACLDVSNGMADRIVSRIQGASLRTAHIPEELLASVADECLATYLVDDEIVVLTAGRWRERFNGLFIRRLPENAGELRACIHEMIVADFASRSARNRGLERKPRFLEDRRSFVYYQALDLFEKEHLLPQIQIATAEIEAYYLEHRAMFLRPAKARGKLLRFADREAAANWLITGNAYLPVNAAEIEVSRESPIPEAANTTDLVLRMENGSRFGPIWTPAGVLVFVKYATENELISHSASAETIKAILTRTKLEELEIRLAAEWAPRYRIEDNLRVEDYGVSSSIQKPWTRVAK